MAGTSRLYHQALRMISVITYVLGQTIRCAGIQQVAKSAQWCTDQPQTPRPCHLDKRVASKCNNICAAEVEPSCDL